MSTSVGNPSSDKNNKNKSCIVFSGEEEINRVRLIALRSALRMEMKGIRATRGFSAYATIKREFGLRGNKQKVFDQFTELLKQAGLSL